MDCEFFIIQCAWCKKYFKKGTNEEVFLCPLPGTLFSHGICYECTESMELELHEEHAKWLKDKEQSSGQFSKLLI